MRCRIARVKTDIGDRLNRLCANLILKLHLRIVLRVDFRPAQIYDARRRHGFDGRIDDRLGWVVETVGFLQGGRDAHGGCPLPIDDRDDAGVGAAFGGVCDTRVPCVGTWGAAAGDVAAGFGEGHLAVGIGRFGVAVVTNGTGTSRAGKNVRAHVGGDIFRVLGMPVGMGKGGKGESEKERSSDGNMEGVHG